MVSTVGHKFSFLEAATTAEHLALLGHSVKKMGDSFRFTAVVAETILMLANLTQISI